MAKEKVLVIGGGMASLRFVEELHSAAPNQFEMTMTCDEPVAAYNRVLLSPLLAGEIEAEDIVMKPGTWFADIGCKVITNTAVASIDTSSRSATLASGDSIAYDHCILATGSLPIRLPVPGAGLDGVHVFRTTQDLTSLLTSAKSGCDIIVIGGGLLGIEAAYGLKRAGARVTLVHLMDRLMERQVDSEAAEILRQGLTAKGITVHLNAETKAIEGKTKVSALTLKDGRRLPADTVVMAIGIRPQTELAKTAGLAIKRGILVDDNMLTSADGVYAIGECCEHRGTVYGLVEPANAHARIAALDIAGKPEPYAGTTLSTNLKVSGVPVFSAGVFDAADAENIVLRDAHAKTYRRFLVKNDKLIGTVMIGDTTDALWYRDLIRDATLIGNNRSLLAFGRAYAEAA
jgi:nitrite reductase (NADH) large subunit